MQALQQSGWTVGQNVRIDYRRGPGNPATMRKYATELVALEPDVIMAVTSAAVAPLLEASRTVPIVFAIVADPVAAGYVESLARPGGNATGFALFEYSISGKWLELLKEIAPRVKRAAMRLGREPANGLIVPPDPSMNTHRELMVAQAALQRLPAIYALRAATAEGGLLSYGVDIPDLFRASSGLRQSRAARGKAGRSSGAGADKV
jgi:putative ABC transport system substrate-binding protein